jgi:ATP-binding cassette subfamily C protein LapB
MVQRHLHTIIHGKTLILVTHRLSMLSMVDRLIVVDSGRIMLDGPKEAVLQRLRGQSTPMSPHTAGQAVAQDTGGRRVTNA